MATTRVKSPQDFTEWLADKPADWVHAIAARAALRVLPLAVEAVHLDRYQMDPFLGPNLVLQTFRAVFSSWAACMYPTSGINTAHAASSVIRVVNEASQLASTASTASRAAWGAAAAVAADTNTALIKSVSRTIIAANKSILTKVLVGSSINTGASAYKSALDFAWDAISADCSWEDDRFEPLIHRRLWPLDKQRDEKSYEDQLQWTRTPLEAFDKLAEGTTWRLIAHWYRAILPNPPDTRPKSLFGEAADVALATQPDEFWTVADDRTPDLIMDEVAGIVGWGLRKSKPETTIAGFIIHFLEDRGTDATIDEIREAFRSAEYTVVDKTMRGELSRLALSGRIVRLKTGVYAKSAPPDVPPSVPPQGHGAKLGLSAGRIALVAPHLITDDGNDFNRIGKFMPLVIDAVEELIAATPSAHSKGGNDPFHRLRRHATAYRQAISDDLRAIDYELLFGLGTMLMNRLAAEENRTLEPELAPLSDRQLNALRDFKAQHGPMMTGSKAALDAIADAEKVNRNPSEERVFRDNAVQFADALQRETRLVEPKTAEVIIEAAKEIGVGHQGERSLLFGKGTIRNTAIVIAAVGTAATLNLVGALAGPAGFVVSGILSLLVVEATKKSIAFQKVVEPAQSLMDELSELDTEEMEVLLEQVNADAFARFALKEEPRLRVIAGDRPEFAWLHDQLDWLKTNYKR